MEVGTEEFARPRCPIEIASPATIVAGSVAAFDLRHAAALRAPQAEPTRQTGRVELPPPTLQSVASPLRIVGLNKRFGNKVALDELTLTVPHGACYGLVGPNGSGKSTTMRTVVGLARADSGTIEVCGVRTDVDIIGVRRTMGVMLDPLQLFDRLSAREFISTIGELRRLDTERRRRTEQRDVRHLGDRRRRRSPDRRIQPRHAQEDGADRRTAPPTPSSDARRAVRRRRPGVDTHDAADARPLPSGWRDRSSCRRT